jgi:hypothetical protein
MGKPTPEAALHAAGHRVNRSQHDEVRSHPASYGK